MRLPFPLTAKCTSMQRMYSILRTLNIATQPVASGQPLGNTERPEEYYPADFFPIKLDEVLNGRYRILRKLGHGKHATVWLAEDRSLARYAALKVSVPFDVNPDPELSALSKLNEREIGTEQTASFVPKLLDHFNLQGHDRKHSVLVLEIFGSTLRQLIDDIQDREMYGVRQRPVKVLRSMVSQMVEAVSFIHFRRLVHRDIQLKNFLLRLRQRTDKVVQQVLQRRATILPPSSFGLAHFGKYGPPYIVEPEVLEDAISANVLPSDLRLVLSDFGAAVSFEDAGDGYQTYPLDVRSPEQILGMPITEKADIWALGCTIYLFVTLRRMFNINGYATAKKRDDQHLQGMIEVLRTKLPEFMLQHWARRDSYVNEEGALLSTLLSNPLNLSLTEQIYEDKPSGMVDYEANQFEDFMKFIMRIDPEQRPTAEEILKHPWLVSETLT